MSEQHGHEDYFVRLPAATAEGKPLPAVGAEPSRSRALPVAVVLGLATVVGLAVTALLVSSVSRDASTVAEIPTAPAAIAGQQGEAPVEDGFVLWAPREDGTPVRWNPCEPIGWVLNPAGAPPTGRVDAEEAVSRVAVATGLEFEFLGTTEELPSRERRLLQGDRYGHRWAPVLIAWVESGTTSLPLAHNERGAAIPVAASGPGGKVFVSGQIVLNGSVPLTAGFDDRHGSWGATLLHELGHLVGLDHVDDRDQLMYPTAVFGTAEFSPGDLRGLAAVGATGGCLEVPPPQDLEVDFSGFSD